MAFHALLRDPADQVFLIHCNTNGGKLHAALLVVDGYVESETIEVSPRGEQSPVMRIELPAEVVGQSERYKGYDVILPIRATHE